MSDTAEAELDRLRALIKRCEFIWGGACPWCGCHARHDCFPNSPCPAFSAPGVVRVGLPPQPKPQTYEERAREFVEPSSDPEKDRH